MREVVVTGIGVVLPGCDSRELLWRQLSAGESQLSVGAVPGEDGQQYPMGVVDGPGLSAHLAEFPERVARRCPRDMLLYLASVVLGRDDAGVGEVELASDRAGLFDGTSRGSFGHWYELIRQDGPYGRRELATATPGQAVGMAAALLGVRGPAYTFGASCSSGAVAVGHAYREVADGRIDIALATGHESVLVRPIYAMYGDANLLSEETEDPSRALRPYADHSGNVFGEGAITLVLEAREHAERRGAPILAVLAGFAYGNDGSHPTHVDPAGTRHAEVLRALLKEARLSVGDVGFVVGHGNGVAMSEQAEMACMREIFGARARQVPLISTKPLYGHTLGAASSLSVAACVLMLHHRRVIRTPNASAGGEFADLCFGGDPAQITECDSAIALSFGLGGHNAAIAVGREAA